MSASAALSPAAAPHVDPGVAPRHLRWLIAISVSIAALMEIVDTSIVNVALTEMQATLGATLSEIGWVVTSYGIANVIMIPLSAWLGERFGKKRYFVFSMVGFTLASVACGLAPTLPLLVFARILQGLAGGGLLAKAQAYLFETFPKAEQGAAQALFGVVVIAGPAIGPTLGGWLTTNYTWPWIFFVNVPIGILATFLCITYLPKDEREKRERKVDWAGIGLLILWVGSLQTFLEQGHDEDWFESNLIWALAIAAVLGLGLWVWRELTTDAPAVDLRVLRHRSLSAGSVYSFVLGAGLYGALFAVPIFAQSILGYTAFQTGMLLLPGALASAFMMPIMGRIAGRIDARFVILTGSLLVALSLFLLSGISLQTGPDDLYWPLILRGAGTVMMFLPLSLATFGPLPKSDVSAASGFYNLTRQLGGSVGIAALTTILAQREAFHRSVLGDAVTPGAPAAIERLNLLTRAFTARGSDAPTAHEQALAAIERTLRVQSAVISFGDVFHLVALAFIVSIPLLFFLGSGRGKAPAADVH